MTLLLTGLLASLICTGFILFRKNSIRQKIFWCSVVLVAIILQRLTEAKFIGISYKTFFDAHKLELSQANTALLKIKGDIILNNYDAKPLRIYKAINNLSNVDTANICTAFRNGHIVFVSKKSDKIFYCLSGFQGIYNGIYYNVDTKTDRKLDGNWYY
jgi:hypothetical protein